MATHERKLLVRRPECRIERCSCGVYHVSTGAVTLRMNAEQLTAVFEALGEALAPAVQPADDGEPQVH
jgi:hypothetical protein